MKLTVRILRSVAGLAVLAATLPMAFGAAAPDAVRDLRVHVVQPQVFPYLFTGIASGATRQPLLTFRDLSGRSTSVDVGGKLDAWTVAGYTSRTERVFNPSVNATLPRDASQATLVGADGTRRILTLGQPLEEAGRMACFVAQTSGQWQYARPGDALELGGVPLVVATIGETEATVQAGDEVWPVALASDEERQAVTTLWQHQREQAEAAARAQAAAVPVVRASPPPPAVATTVSRPAVSAPPPKISNFSMGSEYRYPSAYEAVPISVRMPDGSVRTQAISVPTRFTTRSTGVGFRSP